MRSKRGIFGGLFRGSFRFNGEDGWLIIRPRLPGPGAGEGGWGGYVFQGGADGRVGAE